MSQGYFSFHHSYNGEPYIVYRNGEHFNQFNKDNLSKLCSMLNQNQVTLEKEKNKSNNNGRICETCSYYYHDGFCTYHLSYWNKEHTCPKWTDEKLEIDYKFLHLLCKDYLRICDMYTDYEKLKKEYPEECKLETTDNYDFFLQCCLNDFKREISKWNLKK